MTKHEDFALNHFLCDVPKDKTFDQIIELIEAEDETITVWEPFQNHQPDDVIEYINDMVTTLESAFPTLPNA